MEVYGDSGVIVRACILIEIELFPDVGLPLTGKLSRSEKLVETDTIVLVYQ